MLKYSILQWSVELGDIIFWIDGRERCKELMAGDGQGLGKKISMIADAGDEDGAKVSLSNPVPDPMSAHVNRL